MFLRAVFLVRITTTVTIIFITRLALLLKWPLSISLANQEIPVVFTEISIKRRLAEARQFILEHHREEEPLRLIIGKHNLA